MSESDPTPIVPRITPPVSMSSGSVEVEVASISGYIQAPSETPGGGNLEASKLHHSPSFDLQPPEVIQAGAQDPAAARNEEHTNGVKISSQTLGKLPLDIVNILDLVVVSQGSRPPPQRPALEGQTQKVSGKSEFQDKTGVKSNMDTDATLSSGALTHLLPASGDEYGLSLARNLDTGSSSSSSSEWDSGSDSESDSEAEIRELLGGELETHVPDLGEDDEDEPSKGQTGTELRTANEVVVTDVPAPPIDRLPDSEVIEPIGEILSIVDSVVIVKGVTGKLGDKVLDTGSLLTWDDRIVIGEIFETFGPTHLPLYSIRFPSSSSHYICPNTFACGRKVFHSPQRSHYVFTSSLRNKKGSDASNFYDEEVGDSDLEDFSDDEKERQWKSWRKGKGREHQRSLAQTFAHPDGPTDDGDYPFAAHYYEDRSSQASTLLRTVPASPATGRSAPLPYDDDMAAPSAQQAAPPLTPSRSSPPRFHDRGRVNGSRHQQDGARGRGSRGRGQRGGQNSSRARGRARPSFPGPPGHLLPTHHADLTPGNYEIPMQEYDPRQMHDVSQPFTSPLYGPSSPSSQSGHINPNFVAAAMAGMAVDGMMGMNEMGWPQSPISPFQQPYMGPNHPGFFMPDGMYYPMSGNQPPGDNYWPWPGM